MLKIKSVAIFLFTLTISGSFASEDSENNIRSPIELISIDEDWELVSPFELTRANDPSQALQCNGYWGVRCASCTHLQVCLGNEQVDIKSCGDINPNAPFCNDRSCTATVPAGCKDEVPPSSFTCTDIGFFPNTNNCSRFFLCSAIGEGPREFECPASTVYSSRDGACKRRTSTLDCQTIDCSRQPGRFVVYNPDKSILVYCKRDSSFPVLTRCPDRVNQEYDPNTLQCQFVCRSEGRFADNLDCKKYYECLRNGGSYVKVHRNCDPLIYDRVTGQCQFSPNGCQNQIITTTARPPNDQSSQSSSSTTTTTSTTQLPKP